jgi:P4 family phage/plasmid primase-like protien
MEAGIEPYVEFNKKSECLKYIEANGLQFFQRDINTTCAKLFLATSYECIWNKIVSAGVARANYYESWSSVQPVKFFIDYDRKVDPDEKDTGTASHKNDILNIINTVKQLLPEIKGIHILKSFPDTTKKSYHIIFSGVHFTKIKNLEIYIEEQVKPKFPELFSKKIIDVAVYRPICFRSLLCSKAGQNRPLYIVKTEPFLYEMNEELISADETTYDDFISTCVTHIDADSILYNYKTERKKDNSKKLHMTQSEDIYTDKEIVKKYLDILDASRYTDRSKWLNIAYILKSINPEYIDLWHYFSSRWEGYNEREANTAWDSCNSEFIYTVENLKWLAKIDNLSDHQELSKEIPNHDIKYLRPFDNILSKLIYRMYCDNFVCSDCEHSIWYYFNGNRWMKENKSVHLRKKIIDEVFMKIENYRRQLVKDGAEEEIIKNYYNILQKIGSGLRLNCLELEFYNGRFDKIIDQNKDLIGFENGVYDLSEKEFRRGRASDYVSLSTGYEYIDYNSNDPKYIELLELIAKIIPDSVTRHFVMKSLASCLVGVNREENFYVWSGKSATGGNGKSTLTELMLSALGEYACISPVSLLTSKRESANSANSSLVAIRNKRLVVMQEPGANDQIQSDIMKSLSGGDRISTRELNASQIEFKPIAKMIMCTNRQPSCSETDGGTMRRLKIVEFCSRFVDAPDPENIKVGIHEYQIDRDLKCKLESYHTVFMCILLDYYKMYQEEGLPPPDSVTIATRKYEANNNIVKQFIDEHIGIGSIRTDFIIKEELRTIFNKDPGLKSHFGKFNNFIPQFETAICNEFKQIKGVVKLQGYFIKVPGQEEDPDDQDNRSE